MSIFHAEDLKKAKWLAEINWSNWRNDFEFLGRLADKPILQDEERYLRFCHEYSVLRYKSRTQKLKVLDFIVKKNKLLDALTDTSGGQIDNLATQISNKFTLPGEKKFEEPRSFLSKLASFIQPREFIAYDRYARRGAHFIVNPSEYRERSSSGRLRYPSKKDRYADGYAAYLHDVQNLKDGEAGAQIKRHIGDDSRGDAFTLRVLDCCLMIVGNRWPNTD